MENKEVGQVYIGIALKEDIEVFSLKLIGNRQEIRNECINFAINKLFEKINYMLDDKTAKIMTDNASKLVINGVEDKIYKCISKVFKK
jgi:hypothetical protein